MIVRLAIRYLYHSLPKGYYLAQITKLLGLHLGSSTQSARNDWIGNTICYKVLVRYSDEINFKIAMKIKMDYILF